MCYWSNGFSSKRRHTRCAEVTGVRTCALPICINTHSQMQNETSEITCDVALLQVLMCRHCALPQRLVRLHKRRHELLHDKSTTEMRNSTRNATSDLRCNCYANTFQLSDPNANPSCI